MNKSLKVFFESQLASLDKKCVSNIDDEFNIYLADFLCDFKRVLGPFGKEDWYYYWLENADAINRLINAILEADKPNSELLIKAIKLKRVADENLLKYGEIKEIKTDLGFDDEPTFTCLIPINIDSEKLEDFIKAFYDILISKDWIDGSFENFQTNFVSSEEQIPINWISQQNRLIALLKFMKGKLLNDSPRMAEVMLNNFTWKSVKFKLRSIEVEASKIDDRDHKFKDVLNVVNELIQLKIN